MSRKIKYMVVTGIVLLGATTLNSTKSEATILSRTGPGRFTRFFSSCFGLFKDSHPVVENLNAGRLQKRKLNTLADQGRIVGADAEGFDTNRYSEGTYSGLHYHQVIEGGETKTLVSVGKPKVKKIRNGNVTVKYMDAEGNIQKITTEGVPNWPEGNDIFNAKGKKLNRKMEKYFQSMDGLDDIENFYGRDDI